MRIGLLHPELGLGGAERLVVDAAVELERRGHQVVMFTAVHDRARAFPETLRMDVRVHGAFLPARIAGRMQASCTALRLAWLATRVAAERLDVVVCDLVPYAVPLLKALGRAPVVYYCHYPDQLLAEAPRRGLYALYRAPLDRLEVPAMRAADRVLVNSRFTAGVLAGLGCAAEVVYPGVDVEAYAGVPAAPSGGDVVLLGIARFDPRKNLPLAIDALAELRASAPAAFSRARLHLAGGIDPSRPEGEQLARDLEARAAALGLGDRVVFHRSPSEHERMALLARARCVVHTALDEHFGLVPIEAMAAGRPVVAVAAAGPLETVVDGETGYLCAPTARAFAGALAKLIEEPETADRLGRAGRLRARDRFSRRAFGDALDGVLAGLVAA